LVSSGNTLLLPMEKKGWQSLAFSKRKKKDGSSLAMLSKEGQLLALLHARKRVLLPEGQTSPCYKDYRTARLPFLQNTSPLRGGSCSGSPSRRGEWSLLGEHVASLSSLRRLLPSLNYALLSLIFHFGAKKRRYSCLSEEEEKWTERKPKNPFAIYHFTKRGALVALGGKREVRTCYHSNTGIRRKEKGGTLSAARTNHRYHLRSRTDITKQNRRKRGKTFRTLELLAGKRGTQSIIPERATSPRLRKKKKGHLYPFLAGPRQPRKKKNVFLNWLFFRGKKKHIVGGILQPQL